MPPNVVYKAEHMWNSWSEGGPDGARYNHTKSGWFDRKCFEGWFNSTALPILKRQDRRKVLLGDNLSSHSNPRVLELCKEYNISFECLPPNSTDLIQPLDEPIKALWSGILSDFKATCIDAVVSGVLAPLGSGSGRVGSARVAAEWGRKCPMAA